MNEDSELQIGRGRSKTCDDNIESTEDSLLLGWKRFCSTYSFKEAIKMCLIDVAYVCTVGLQKTGLKCREVYMGL